MKPKKRLTYQRFLAYFNNKLSNKERHYFEKSVMQDDFESEAFDGLSKLKTNELQDDLHALNLILREQTNQQKKRKLIWLPYAAGVIVLLSLSLLLFYINESPQLDGFVSQEIEIDKQENEFDIVDTISESSEQKIKREETPLEVKVLEDDMELEIADVDSAEDLYEEELVVVLEEEEEDDYEEIQLIENEKAKQAEVEVGAEQMVAPVMKSKKVSKALEGKAAGVQVSKNDSNIRIRGVSSFRREKKGKKITGLVVNEDKTPMPGVMIFVQGTNKGAITDLDGKFEMNLADTNVDYKLTASFVGFETKEVALSDSLLVVLEQDNTALSEVVVVGYESSSQDQRGESSWQKARPSNSKSIREYKRNLIDEIQKLDQVSGKYRFKVSFHISADGEIDKLILKGSNDSILVDKINTLILEGEKWIPAKSNNSNVESIVKFTLRFELD